jgi:nucleoside-diphosphate-sugar epimerase
VSRAIGIIGANGRVGSEVTLLLTHMHDIDVVPISRSEYGAAFLRQCGVSPLIASTDDELAHALGDCDLVVDLSLASGGTSQERRQRSSTHVRRMIALSPSGVPFVFASTMMAFGMRHGERTCRRYLISRTSYGTEKRRQEREVREATGGSNTRPAYVLRFAEVHGEIQPVTRYYVNAVTRGAVTVTRGLDSPSTVITCFTIANALRNIADGREDPGRYTVVEQPEWTWRQFYEWVAVNSGVEVALSELPTSPSYPGPVRMMKPVLARLGASFFRLAAENRDVITSHFHIPPRIEYRFRIEYQRRKVASEVEPQIDQPEPRDHMLGPVPGRRLRDRTGMDERRDAEMSVRKLLDDRLSPQSHHFLSRVHWAPGVPRGGSR